jgi:hypothetical protein
LEAGRLQLRPFSAGDLEELYAFHSLAEVLKDEGQVLALAVVLRATGVVVGEVSLQGLATEAAEVVLGLGFDGLACTGSSGAATPSTSRRRG